MTKIEFTGKSGTMSVEPTELWCNVFGTAGESMPWWQAVEFVEGDWDTVGRVRLEIDNPDDEFGVPVTGTYGLEDVIEAVQKVIDTCVDACTGQPIEVGDDMDWDACVSDCVLQTLVLGEVVYG